MIHKSFSPKKFWQPKNIVCHVAHTSLLAYNNDLWYFDSGCSRHMTGNKAFLNNLVSYDAGFVTFGDGFKSKILSKGLLTMSGLPLLKDVLLMDGLKANLLSIS